MNNKFAIKSAGLIFLLLFQCFSAQCSGAEDINMDMASSLFSDTPNAAAPLQFNNYLGNNENIHPKVLYFENGWNGYKYWMAYTPYPGGATNAENPCIAVSNDGIDWEAPQGLQNPLFPEFEGGYNSDTHLVYNNRLERLECWWRPHDQANHKVYVCRRTTKDGVNWTNVEKVLESTPQIKAILSPVVLYNEDGFTLYYSDGVDIRIMKCADDDMFNWSAPELVPIERDDLSLWHQDVIEYEPGVFEFVICAFGPGDSHNAADLYYVRYDSGLNEYSKPVKILSRSADATAFDSRSIYRASILRVDNKYMVYYSSIDFSRHRHMALSIGDSPFTLRGYNPLYSGVEVVEKDKDIIKVEGNKIIGENGSFSVWTAQGMLLGNSFLKGNCQEFVTDYKGIVLIRTLSKTWKVLIQ